MIKFFIFEGFQIYANDIRGRYVRSQLALYSLTFNAFGHKYKQYE